METNQITPKANQSQNNNYTILRTLEDADLESLSGGGIDAYLRLDGVDGESAESSDTLEFPIKVRHDI